MKVRKGKKSDVNELVRLYCTTWPKEKPRRVENYFIEKVKNNETFVVIEDGKLVGVISFTKSWWKGADYVDEVVVSKEHRRKGIASRLLLIFEKDARRRKARRLFGSTQPSNRISILLQQKAGYKKCGYVKDMFEEGQKELIFSKKI